MSRASVSRPPRLWAARDPPPIPEPESATVQSSPCGDEAATACVATNAASLVSAVKDTCMGAGDWGEGSWQCLAVVGARTFNSHKYVPGAGRVRYG